MKGLTLSFPTVFGRPLLSKILAQNDSLLTKKRRLRKISALAVSQPQNPEKFNYYQYEVYHRWHGLSNEWKMKRMCYRWVRQSSRSTLSIFANKTELMSNSLKDRAGKLWGKSFVIRQSNRAPMLVEMSPSVWNLVWNNSSLHAVFALAEILTFRHLEKYLQSLAHCCQNNQGVSSDSKRCQASLDLLWNRRQRIWKQSVIFARTVALDILCIDVARCRGYV